MTHRERFRAAANFEPTDQPCHVIQGFWSQTHPAWQEQGLPPEVRDVAFSFLGESPDLCEYFDVSKFCFLNPNQYCIPAFESEVLEETERYVIVRDGWGRTMKSSKTGPSLPQELDHPVKTREDYENYKWRLDPDAPGRWPENWAELAVTIRDQQRQVVAPFMVGFFAHPREICGVQGTLTLYYDDPDLMHDIINDRCEFLMRVFEPAIRATRPDCVYIWEDMSYANGPLISPATFREFLLPAYRRLTGFLRDLGLQTIIVDSDGDARALLPLWLEGGVDMFLPLEVNAGMDVVEIGRQYPDLRLMGGINKHALETTRGRIDAELQRVLPAMLQRGGYVVSLDHWVHPAISLENFRYYVERVRAWK